MDKSDISALCLYAFVVHNLKKMKPLPLIVYKYRNWENALHRNALIYNEIYLSSPKNFNDPFDCRITPNFKSLNADEEEQYIIDMGVAGFKYAEQKKVNFGKVLDSFAERLKDKEKMQQEYDNLLYENQDKYYGIFSLSCRWNSILMWSHYANCHQGICIGYWLNKFIKTNEFGKIGHVSYSKSYPIIKPRAPKNDEKMISNSFIETFTKSEEWTYEDEFRLLKGFFPKVPLAHERLFTIPPDFIAEVILGINISDKNKSEIIDLCCKKKIPIYQAKKVSDRFEIDREII